MSALIEGAKRRLFNQGPDRVLVDNRGTTVSAARAKMEFGIEPDLVLIRVDGWMLSCPWKLAPYARSIWVNQWAAEIVLNQPQPKSKPSVTPTPAPAAAKPAATVAPATPKAAPVPGKAIAPIKPKSPPAKPTPAPSRKAPPVAPAPVDPVDPTPKTPSTPPPTPTQTPPS